MSKRIYVGNLPYSITDDGLRELFGSFGEVTDAKVIIDRQSGRSKGFGFVEMADEAKAEEAIKGLHDTENGGRKLVVNEARERTETPRFQGGQGGGGSYGGNRGGSQSSQYTSERAEKPAADEAPAAVAEADTTEA